MPEKSDQFTEPNLSYTFHVAGPVKPIPEDAPFLPISVREKLAKAKRV